MKVPESNPTDSTTFVTAPEDLDDVPDVSSLVTIQVGEANKLGVDTDRVCRAFKQAKEEFSQLQGQGEPWTSRWQAILQLYTDTTKKALALDKKGHSYFGDFVTKVINNIDWSEKDFGEVKALVDKFADDPVGVELETGSKDISQFYTDNRRDVAKFKQEFSFFVDGESEKNKRALDQYHGEMGRLDAEIESYNSAGNTLLRGINQIAGIPGWMTWAISEILNGLGIASAEDARLALDMNYAEQKKIKDRQAEVQRKAQEVRQIGDAYERAKMTLAILNSDVNDINSRLDSFAAEWAQYHHDIIDAELKMKNAADSATKRALVRRVQILALSLDMLLKRKDAYVKVVDCSGLFN